jgi:hypothetical protein
MERITDCSRENVSLWPFYLEAVRGLASSLWNRIPDSVRSRIVTFAAERSPRELARFAWMDIMYLDLSQKVASAESCQRRNSPTRV